MEWWLLKAQLQMVRLYHAGAIESAERGVELSRKRETEEGAVLTEYVSAC